MSDNMDAKVNKLKEEYRKIFQKNEKPDWAVKKHQNSADPVRPSIPFIGREYQNAPKKVLVYASAENLTFYCDEKYDSNYLDNDKYAENRHRNKFEETKEDFFPDIHIGPMNNGALATAVLYICTKFLGFDLPERIKPAEFYEKIAVANYCKFSIHDKKNKDHANDSGKLECSKEYVKADLEVLKPDYIILPKTIYDNNEWIISDYAKDNNIKCIPIMQINQTTINCHIKKYSKKMPEGAVHDWYEHLGIGNGKPRITGKTKENYMAVFDYLDTVLGELKLI